jgi:hypothetical protein
MMVAGNPHMDTLVHPGRCPAHGMVQATKQVPKVRFPFLVFGALRLWAHQRPYCCPACGTAVDRA